MTVEASSPLRHALDGSREAAHLRRDYDDAGVWHGHDHGLSGQQCEPQSYGAGQPEHVHHRGGAEYTNRIVLSRTCAHETRGLIDVAGAPVLWPRRILAKGSGAAGFEVGVGDHR